jgi:hypothetical protein
MAIQAGDVFKMRQISKKILRQLAGKLIGQFRNYLTWNPCYLAYSMHQMARTDPKGFWAAWGNRAAFVAVSHRLQCRSGASLCVPESEHFNSRRCGSIVEVVVDPRQVDPPAALETGVNSSRAYVGLRGNKSEGTFQLFANRIGRIGTVFPPPLGGFLDLANGSLCDTNRQPPAQSGEPSLAMSSAPSTISPRLASAIAARRAASSSGPSSNVSASSAAITVTLAPSSKGAPSITTFPATTFPVATRMIQDCTERSSAGPATGARYTN